MFYLNISIRPTFFLSVPIVLLVLVLHLSDANLSNSSGTHFETFEEYKSRLNKTYHQFWAESRSRRAFEENMELIKRHNALAKNGTYSFELRSNVMADFTNTQYLRRFVRLTESLRRKLQDERYEQVGASLFPDNDLPESLDWREKGFVMPPNNQKSCGSCYAYSIAHSISGQVYKRTGLLIPLSEQQLVDCSVLMGNHGCFGGSLRNTLRYLERSGGLMRAQDYPYTASQNRCKFNPELAVVNVTTWAILPTRDEDALKNAVATIGPIAVSINASPKTFQLYSQGVYDDRDCSAEKVNHAMLLLGYTPEYWILKNWWGKNWGNDGYMKIKRGVNQCGLSNFAAYAVV